MPVVGDAESFRLPGLMHASWRRCAHRPVHGPGPAFPLSRAATLAATAPQADMWLQHDHFTTMQQCPSEQHEKPPFSRIMHGYARRRP